MAFVAEHEQTSLSKHQTLRTCAVSIVSSILPHRSSSEDINLRTCGALREDCSIYGCMPLQHTSEGSLLLCTRSLGLVMERSCGVGGPCAVLAANVDNGQGSCVDDWAPMSRWEVMWLPADADVRDLSSTRF